MTSTLNKTPNLPEILSGTILVTGAGISGVGIARLLADLNVDVLIADANETARDRAMEVADVAGIHPDQALAELSRFSCVVTSPGWRPDTPLLRAAQAAGLEVLGDVELCYRLDRASVFGPPRTWMVVTGTNGKTTTTSMLASIMQHAGYQAEAVGNIGVSVAEAISAPQRIDVLVAELSSFQLHWSSQLVPDVGVLLNLAEDHIDWHGSMAAYAAAKAKVLAAPLAIAGLDDALVQQYVTTPVMGFTMHPPQAGQVGVTNGTIVDNLHGTPPEYCARGRPGTARPGRHLRRPGRHRRSGGLGAGPATISHRPGAAILQGGRPPGTTGGRSPGHRRYRQLQSHQPARGRLGLGRARQRDLGGRRPTQRRRGGRPGRPPCAPAEGGCAHGSGPKYHSGKRRKACAGCAHLCYRRHRPAIGHGRGVRMGSHPS